MKRKNFFPSFFDFFSFFENHYDGPKKYSANPGDHSQRRPRSVFRALGTNYRFEDGALDGARIKAHSARGRHSAGMVTSEGFSLFLEGLRCYISVLLFKMVFHYMNIE